MDRTKFLCFLTIIFLSLIVTMRLVFHHTGIPGMAFAVFQDTSDATKDVANHVLDQYDTNRSNILILTSARSGSSYIGYLFSSNPDIFYMFEPLRVFFPQNDDQARSDIVNSSEINGYKCINKSVSCRLNYLFSCQVHQYFKEALFRMPRNAELISKWYGIIFAQQQRNLHIKAKNAGLDVLCKERFKIVAAKPIRVD